MEGSVKYGLSLLVLLPKSRLLTFLSVILLFAKMPVFQHPRSLIARFPDDVYLNSGSTTVLPQLLERLDADKVLAVQFV